MSRARRGWLAALLLSAACGGSVATPMVQVPLFRRQGQGEAGLVIGPASRRPELGGTLRYAPTDTLRIGGSVSGAGGEAVAHSGELDPRDQAPKLFADGFFGAEWSGLAFRLGALAGSGYGLRAPTARVCRADASGLVVCSAVGPWQTQSAFVRSYGQLHMAFAPPGLFAVSLAVRVPVTVELPHDTHGRITELGTEVALTQTLLLGRLRLDIQPLWSRTRGFAFHLALLFRFSGSAH